MRQGGVRFSVGGIEADGTFGKSYGLMQTLNRPCVPVITALEIAAVRLDARRVRRRQCTSCRRRHLLLRSRSNNPLLYPRVIGGARRAPRVELVGMGIDRPRAVVDLPVNRQLLLSLPSLNGPHGAAEIVRDTLPPLEPLRSRYLGERAGWDIRPSGPGDAKLPCHEYSGAARYADKSHMAKRFVLGAALQ